MKFYITILLLICIISNTVDARRLRKHRGKGTPETPSSTNKLAQFFVGFGTELTGGISFDECLPDDWKNSNETQEKQMTPFNANITSEMPLWKKIFSLLGVYYHLLIKLII